MEVVGQLVGFHSDEAWFYGVEVRVELLLVVPGYEAQIGLQKGKEKRDELLASSNNVLPEPGLRFMNPRRYA